jgi:hypothetical protein
MNHDTEIPPPRPGGWRHFSKRRAFLAHLSISAAVVGTVCLLIFSVWYPEPYFAAKGAWNVLRILVGVDLVLGPLLTLILFKPEKPGLLLDVTMIALVQLCALVYGTTVIFQERPYYVVFAIDRFEILTKNDIEASAVENTPFADKPLVGPVLAVAQRPSDVAEYQRLLEETVFGGKPDIERRPEFWSPFTEQRAAVLSRSRSLTELADRDPMIAERISGLAARLGRDPSDLSAAPVISRADAKTFVIDAKTALPLAVLDIDPWAQ